MPDVADGARRLEMVPDLTIEVGDARGSTSARLTGDGRGDAIFEVDDLTVFLRCLPKRSAWSGVPTNVPVVHGISLPTVRLRSGGPDLAHIRVDHDGRIHWRVAPRGALAAARVGLALVPRGAVGASAAASAAVVLWWVVRAARR